jgi:beta-glucosidase
LVTPSGKPGWLCTFYSHDDDDRVSNPIAEYVLKDTRIKLNDFLPEGITPNYTIKLTGRLTFDKTAAYELGLTVAGKHNFFYL